MQRQHGGASAQDDARSFESRQFCHSGMKSFGEPGLFQHLAEFLGLRTAFKLRSSGTTLASMVSGASVKNVFEMDRLLCQFAMEEFVKQWQCEDLPVYADNLRVWNADTAAWIVDMSEHEFLQIVRDFGDIFQEGLCVHQRSCRYTQHRASCESHGGFSEVGIIWTSTPAAAVWMSAATRRRENYGEDYRNFAVAPWRALDVCTCPECFDVDFWDAFSQQLTRRWDP